MNGNWGKHPNVAEKNGNWKGNNIKRQALHIWVRSRLPRPDVCEMCKEVPPYDLANATGIYSRELSNWRYLCRRCHMKSDARMAALRCYFGMKDKHHSDRAKNAIRRARIAKLESLKTQNVQNVRS